MRRIPTPSSDLDRLFRHGDRTAAAPDVTLDFSVSVNPLGPPEVAFPAIVEPTVPLERAGITRYPDPDSSALTERLAWRHGVAPAQVVVGNGANDLIYATARALRPGRAAIVEPTYTEYLRASRLAGATVEHWLPEDAHFQPAPFDPDAAEVIWLCNPNNPTGRLWPTDALRSWVESFPRVTFIVDEAFLPFLADEAEHTVVPAVDSLANLVVLRSLTKVYGLPGLRLGYAVSSPALAARLREQVVPWSVNAIAQAVGAAVLDDETLLPRTRAWLPAALETFTSQLAGCSACLEPLPSRANFVLVRLKDLSSGWLTQRLLERGIAVRDASNFVGLGPQYIRVALRKPEENQRLLHELHLLLLEG
jgi:threonine-phosphate decarboxylase